MKNCTFTSESVVKYFIEFWETLELSTKDRQGSLPLDLFYQGQKYCVNRPPPPLTVTPTDWHDTHILYKGPLSLYVPFWTPIPPQSPLLRPLFSGPSVIPPSPQPDPHPPTPPPHSLFCLSVFDLGTLFKLEIRFSLHPLLGSQLKILLVRWKHVFFIHSFLVLGPNTPSAYRPSDLSFNHI